MDKEVIKAITKVMNEMDQGVKEVKQAYKFVEEDMERLLEAYSKVRWFFGPEGVYKLSPVVKKLSELSKEATKLSSSPEWSKLFEAADRLSRVLEEALQFSSKGIDLASEVSERVEQLNRIRQQVKEQMEQIEQLMK
jgi:methyl-accepting chemotaxis protein